MTVVDAAAWTGRQAEDKLEADVSRGRRARAIIEDDLVVHALKSMRDGVRDEFFKTRPRDEENRERLWLLGQMVERFEEHFRSLIAEGEMAAGKVAALREHRKNPLKRFIG